MSLPSTWRGSWWSPRRWSSPRPSGRRWSWSWFTQCGFFITNQRLLLTLRTSLLRAWVARVTRVWDVVTPSQSSITSLTSVTCYKCDKGLSVLSPPSPTQPRPSRHAPAPQAWCSDQQRARRSVWLLIGQPRVCLSSHWSTMAWVASLAVSRPVLTSPGHSPHNAVKDQLIPGLSRLQPLSLSVGLDRFSQDREDTALLSFHWILFLHLIWFCTFTQTLI